MNEYRDGNHGARQRARALEEQLEQSEAEGRARSDEIEQQKAELASMEAELTELRARVPTPAVAADVRVCSRCGRQNPADLERCLDCGLELPQTAAARSADSFGNTLVWIVFLMFILTMAAISAAKFMMSAR